MIVLIRGGPLGCPILKLVRAYLTAGIMAEGVLLRAEEGTPQGSPLTPLLANVMLDDLDQELIRRGHRFVRYADDIMIYAKSERAGERVRARPATTEAAEEWACP